MIVSLHGANARMTVLVDPEAPLIWREQPYLDELQSWSQKYPVTVMVQTQVYAIYPDLIEDLGVIRADEQIEILETQHAEGSSFRQHRVRKSDLHT